MKLVLKNIGMLKDATVTLQPLSVIAGENDNGKSTVGKIMFCIVKAINRYIIYIIKCYSYASN